MKKGVYKPRKGARISNAKAQVYGEYLYKLSEETGDGLNPAYVVEKAEDIKSPIHDYFEWDNTEAARKYRLRQAGELMRSIVVEYQCDGKRGDTRMFMNVHSEDIYNDEEESEEGSRKYIYIEKVVNNKGYLEQIIDDAYAEMKSWNRKYKRYASWKEFKVFTTIFSEIDKLTEPV